MHRGFAIALLVLFGACQAPNPLPLDTALGVEPEGFPPIHYPADNAFQPARWELGKQLFFDKRLSRDATVSCATCHQPERAFSDGLAVSAGIEGRLGTRNAPSLANVAYHPYFTREGGVPTLEMQVLVPVQEHNEFDFNVVLIAERLAQDSSYQRLSREAYDREMDYYVVTRALANFERSLLSGNSPYDQQVANPKAKLLSRAAKRGQSLFFSERTNCSHCHGGVDFTTYAFENNGLYAEYEDPGRFRLTNQEADRARFKVPSLRNVAVTAPYMHDGSFQSLAEVIAHYNAGGKGHPHQSELVRPLQLTEREQQDLLAFLHSLTDESFLHNSHWQFP